MELEPPDRKVGGSSPAAVMLFPEKRVSVFLWTSLLINFHCLFNNYSKPLADTNVNEEFLDLAEAYYEAKFSIGTIKTNLRNDLMKPLPTGKKV